MSATPARSVAADYAARGPIYQTAWAILARHCDFPPSLEQFEHELAQARREKKNISVEALARRLGKSYHRTRGFFDDEHEPT